MITRDILDKILVVSDLCNKSVDAEIMNKYTLRFSLIQTDVPKILSNNLIKGDDLNHNRYEIDLKQFPDCEIFLDEQGLRGRTNTNKDFLTQKDIIILKFEGSYLYYEQSSNTTYVNSIKKDDCFLIQNLKHYLSLIEYLKSTSFVDYYNGADREAVIYSATKGIFKLQVPAIPVKLDSKVNFENDITTLLKKLGNSDYSIHFKNKLFNLDKKLDEDQILTLINNLGTLINEAENDYQLQLKNFSFDKFKSDLQKEKEKYFSSLREILSKILGQIVGVPVSIAASTFASYKIESVFILILVLVAFGIYVCFAIYFQWIYYNDIEEIEIDFKEDFKKIKDKSGLIETDIAKERIKIERRIRAIKSTIVIFVSSILILTLLFGIYLCQQIKAQNQPKAQPQVQSIDKKDTIKVQVRVQYKPNRIQSSISKDSINGHK